MIRLVGVLLVEDAAHIEPSLSSFTDLVSWVLLGLPESQELAVHDHPLFQSGRLCCYARVPDPLESWNLLLAHALERQPEWILQLRPGEWYPPETIVAIRAHLLQWSSQMVAGIRLPLDLPEDRENVVRIFRARPGLRYARSNPEQPFCGGHIAYIHTPIKRASLRKIAIASDNAGEEGV